MVQTVSVTPAVPPLGSDTDDGSVEVGPGGVIVDESATVPVKPFLLLTSIIDVSQLPCAMVRLVGLALMTKSGGGGGDVTVTDTFKVCDRLPLMPVTVTV